MVSRVKSRVVVRRSLQDVGVTQKVLHLVREEGGGCPRQKLITRPCGRRRTKKKKRLLPGVSVSNDVVDEK